MPLQRDQLSRMTIHGFKSIKSCDISFGKINVLIGSNGAGKSNFISSFSFLQNILSKNLQVSVGQSGLTSLLYKGRKVTEEIDFEVFFGQNSYGFVLVPTDDNRLIFQKEYFCYHGQWDNESNIGRGHSESNWETGAHNQIDNYVIPILRKQNWRVYHFHDTGKGARVKQEHNISNNRVLMYDAANLAAFLYRLKITSNRITRRLWIRSAWSPRIFRILFWIRRRAMKSKLSCGGDRPAVRISLMPLSFQMERCVLFA